MLRGCQRYMKGLLSCYDWQAKQVRPLLDETFGDRAPDVEQRERDEFVNLIGQLDCVGPIWNYFVWEAIVGVMAVALYRALRAEGIRDADCATLMYRAYEHVAEGIPDRVASFQTYLTHSRPVALYMKAQAALSRKRRHPGFFVFDYIPGSETDDWGLDFRECAIKKFCEKVGNPECLPMICTIDFPIGQRFGWGLRRDQTISAGATTCTFRFRRGRDTPSAAPTVEAPHWLLDGAGPDGP